MAEAESSAAASFSQRNIFYLRVSPTVVLPCILYLDSRHILWLNTHPSIFHSTLRFLKDRLLAKLEREAKWVYFGDKGRGDRGGVERRLLGEMSGKEVVDVARQSDYHLAYFFRRQADKHAVLLKEKQVIFPGAEKGVNGPARKRKAEDFDSNQDAVGHSSDPLGLGLGGQGSSDDVQIKQDPEEAEDAEFAMLGSTPAPQDDGSEADPYAQFAEDEDQKPKFKLKLQYRGFRIFSKCLILVLEPSPAARARSPDLFLSQTQTERRQLSVTPSTGIPSAAGSGMMDPRPSTRSRGRGVAASRADSEASTSMRDGRSRTRTATPLFRGSMTPSDAGDALDEPDFGRVRRNGRDRNAQDPERRRVQGSADTTVSMGRDRQSFSFDPDVDFNDDGGEAEPSFDLAERMLGQAGEDEDLDDSGGRGGRSMIERIKGRQINEGTIAAAEEEE